MTPLIAHEFILPRLENFQSNHPGLSLSIEAGMEPIDAAIRVGNGDWPGLQSWLLCECEAVLLAAPTLLADEPVKQLTDLKNHNLIRRRVERFGWDALAKLTGLDAVPCRAELMVDSDLAAVHAAERGLGLALGFLPAGIELAQLWPAHQLVAVLPPFKTPLTAYFVSRPNSGKDALLKDAFAWIRAQVTVSGNSNT